MSRGIKALDLRKALMETYVFVRHLIGRFFADNAFDSAAALTYTTLFAVVPMMMVTFTMLSAIPAFQGMGEEIQGFIFKNFVPSSGTVIQEYLQGFTSQARHLTWVGVAVLAVTAFMMLVTIEKAFNTIWRVPQPRRGLSSFLIYWAILSLGPLLLGAGFAATTYITSLSLISGPDALPGVATLLGYAPLLCSVAAFTLIYAIVPNARVPLRHALVGGVFTAVLFEAAKGLFAIYVGYFPSFHLIYGAFAAVPLFLLWIYLSWLIVLFGAELVCNLSFSYRWSRRRLPRLLVALGVLEVFLAHQRKGAPVRLRDVQRAGWRMPDDEWGEVLRFLEGQRLVCPVAGDSWVLCRDLNSFSLHQLLRLSPWPLPNGDELPQALDRAWYADFLKALAALEQTQQQLFDDSLADWLDRGGEDDR